MAFCLGEYIKLSHLKVFALKINKNIENEITNYLALSDYEGKTSLIGLAADIEVKDFLSELERIVTVQTSIVACSIIVLNIDNRSLVSQLIEKILKVNTSVLIIYPNTLQLTGLTDNCIPCDIENEGFSETLYSLKGHIEAYSNAVPDETRNADYMIEKIIQESIEEDSEEDLPTDEFNFEINNEWTDTSSHSKTEIEHHAKTTVDTVEGIFESGYTEFITKNNELDKGTGEHKETRVTNEQQVISEHEQFVQEPQQEQAITEQMNEQMNEPFTDIEQEVDREDHVEGGEVTEQVVIIPAVNPKQTERIDTVDTAHKLQKNLFAYHRIEKNKSIAVWSPLPRVGVTNFVINFAAFLAENHVRTCVIEGIRGDNKMKHILRRYSNIPHNWKSYAQNISDLLYNTEKNDSTADWKYRNVLFLPLDDTDSKLHWNPETLDAFFTAPQIMDVIMIDLPSGEMSLPTAMSLSYVDELWIVIDDTFQEIAAWKTYIALLKKQYNLEVKMIHGAAYDFSETKRLAEVMELQLLTSIPAMHQLVMANYYQTEPLIALKEARELLVPSYTTIARELLGKSFKVVSTVETKQAFWLNSYSKIPSWTTIFEIIKSLLKF